MRCDVIIKAWYGDLCWLSYCLRFLVRNWREVDSNIIVLADRNCQEVIKTWGWGSQIRYFYVDPWPDGNQFQCYLTLLSDHFSNADLFAIFDCDTMLLEPMTASDKMVGGKPIIWFDPYDESDLDPRRAIPRQMWAPIMERWLGARPQADYMQRFPMIYFADTLRAVRRLVTTRTGCGLLESLYSATPYSPGNFPHHPFKFCEHNVIGFYCALHEADRYEIRDVRHAPLPQPRVHQYHSWSEWGIERIAEFDRMLVGDYVPERIPTKVTAQGWTILDGDVRDGHSSLVEQRGTIEVDVGSLPTHSFIRPYLRPGSAVIDVGAHIGNFTIPIMRALGPDGLVIAYEPHPGIFPCLEANVRKEMVDNPRAARCVTFQYALGPERRKAALYCNPTNYASNTVLEGILGPATVEIDVRTLDESLELSFIPAISFIKIDVEGGEYGVLRGASQLISLYHPVLFMETSENFFPLTGITEEEFYLYLRSIGYRKLVPFPQEWVDQGHHAHDVLALP